MKRIFLQLLFITGLIMLQGCATTYNRYQIDSINSIDYMPYPVSTTNPPLSYYLNSHYYFAPSYYHHYR